MDTDRELALPIIAYGFNGATLHGFVTEFQFLAAFRLLEEIGIPPIIVPSEVIWSRFPAKVTIDALVIDIELAFLIVFVTIF